jgi:hypothetical protein
VTVLEPSGTAGENRILYRMPYSWMVRLVALERADVSEELNISIFRVSLIGELGKTLAVSSNRLTLRNNKLGIFNYR